VRFVQVDARPPPRSPPAARTPTIMAKHAATAKTSKPLSESEILGAVREEVRARPMKAITDAVV